MRSLSRKVGLYGASLLAISTSLGAVQARAETSTVVAPQEVAFNVPAGDLGAALTAFARQANQEILFTSALVSGRRTSGVQGRYTASDALQIILRDTGLEVASREGSVVTLRQVSGSARSPSADLGEPVQLAEIIVEGSTTLNADIRRTEDDSRPYIVFSSDDIRTSQASTVGEFLSDYLPVQRPPYVAPGPNFLGSTRSSQLKLRGLEDVLVLVDGRPAAPGVTIDRFVAGDVNGIPPSSIERIEVLPASSGAMYGANAVGGVINIILKQNYSGLSSSVYYNNTFDTDSGDYRWTVDGGHSFNDGRTRVSIAASLVGGNYLLTGDRPWQELARRNAAEYDPARIYNGIIPPSGATSNIRSLFGNNLVLLDGRNLGSPNTYVPTGYVAGGDPSGFLNNAGEYNFDLPDDLNGNLRSLSAPSDTYAVNATLRHRFTDRLDAYASYFLDQNSGSSLYAGVPAYAIVAPGAPHNPFQNYIVATFPAVGIVRESRTEAENTRAVLGATVTLPRDWRAAIELSQSTGSSVTRYTDVVLDAAGTAALGSGRPSADGRPAVNFIQDPSVAPVDLSPYFLPEGRAISDVGGVTVDTFTVRAGGDAGRLFGAPITLAVGLDYADNQLHGGVQTSTATWTSPYSLYYSYIAPRSTRSKSAFLSASWPFLREQQGSSLGQRGELTASVRYDDYSYRTLGSDNCLGCGGSDPTTYPVPSPDGPFPDPDYTKARFDRVGYTLAGLYAPTADIMFRSSIASGFQPPQFNLLSTNEVNYPTGTLFGLYDPKRGGVASGIYLNSEGPMTFRGGGRPDLLPAESQTVSIGGVFTPRGIPGLRLSVDYVDITRENEIVQKTLQEIFELEDFLPGRVVREDRPLTPAEIAAGYTATPVILIDATALNLAKSRIRAFDYQLDYFYNSERWGDFRFYAVVSNQLEFSNQISTDSDSTSYLGGYGGYPTRWRGNLGLEWSRNAWSASWRTIYNGKSFPYNGSRGEDRDLAIRTNGGRDTLPADIRHDVLVNVNFAETGLPAWVGDTRLSIGVRNVFDTDPYVSGLLKGDYIGRRYSINLTRNF